jgi:diaminohydroxyphosphoribosylaminopyrimidine deaminase/5-amino-6-(5-phosphoribosylamino)uracil reductase
VESIDGSLANGLCRLAELGVQSVLVEGGASLQQAAWEAGMIDEVRLFVAPDPLGPAGVPLLPGRGLLVPALSDVKTIVVGPDVLITGYVHRPH